MERAVAHVVPGGQIVKNGAIAPSVRLLSAPVDQTWQDGNAVQEKSRRARSTVPLAPSRAVSQPSELRQPLVRFGANKPSFLLKTGSASHGRGAVHVLADSAQFPFSGTGVLDSTGLESQSREIQPSERRKLIGCRGEQLRVLGARSSAKRHLRRQEAPVFR